jgi:hypothetical protein
MRKIALILHSLFSFPGSSNHRRKKKTWILFFFYLIFLLLLFYNLPSSFATHTRIRTREKRRDTFVYECVYEPISGVLSTRDALPPSLPTQRSFVVVSSSKNIKGKNFLRDYEHFPRLTKIF